MKQLVDLYRSWRGEDPVQIEKLPGAGSNRAYYRLFDGQGT